MQEESKLEKYKLDLSDPVTDIGIVIRLGISAIPIPLVKNVLSTLLSIIWPKTEEDIWSKIKGKVKDLIDEEIDNSKWEDRQSILEECKEKIEKFNDSLRENDIAEAINKYQFLKEYFVGKEVYFKLDGHKVKYSFSPLYCIMVSLIFAFRKSVIEHKDELGLTEKEVENEEITIRELLTNAINYINEAKEEHENIYNGAWGLSWDLNKLLKFNQYYQQSVFVFIQIWEQSVDLSPSDNPPIINLAFPGIAAGSTSCIVDENNNYIPPEALKDVMTPKSEGEKINAVTLYKHSYKTELIGVDVSYADGRYVRLGDNSSGNYQELRFDANEFNNMTSMLVRAEEPTGIGGFIGSITVGSNTGESISIIPREIINQNNSPNAILKLNEPYRIARILGSKFEWEISGNQMISICCGVIYDNELATARAKKLLENTL
ncbi:hypothetical protein KKI95_19510 [Xenorhabdus bovienii]|uniref:insecticidal delta-endotoxin Cry8Ea1 family protein n=1 Tax=Xenorhabdus bovienii TaxID=40576 RepID=UPI0023B2DCFB|nr:insecticidal delta-endotoxin Cry8Ea1 family protein [Xenorhabdus bovienii]MDE9438026.1 hypothetical protein [Xenorhabdus bovienii]MDE9467340.1 hypothetical protein [Xenorhabdus bovienii]MDE9499847.1 hypothetical protein [Xenorhabdus bovienii]